MRAGLLVLATASVLVLSSCGLSTGKPAASGSGSPKSQTGVIASHVVPETLDPQQASNANNDFYIAGLYDRILAYNSKGEVVPRLASKFEYAGDAKSIVLTIRDDVKFHSGNALTPDDVVYTLERVHKIASGSAGFLTDYVSSKTTGKNQVTITLKDPNLSFAGALALIYVVDSKLVKQHEGSDMGQQWLSSNEAGSGPYTLKSYNPALEVDLTRYDGYWDGEKKRPSGLVMHIYKENSAIRDETLAGTADIGSSMAVTDLAAFKGKNGFHVNEYPSPLVTLGAMNTAGGITKDVRVREAIQLAYDYSAHIKNALKEWGKPGDGLVPSYMQCRYSTTPTVQDVAKAKQLIQEAGVAGQTVTIAYQSIIPEQSTAGTILEANLRDIGLNVQVKQITFSQYLEMIKKPETTPDVSILWDLAQFPEIGSMLTHTWSSTAIGQSNFTRYSNPAVDKLLTEGTTTTDKKTACSDFEQAQKQIIADHPAMLMALPSRVQVQNDKFAKIPYSPIAATYDISLLTLAK
ncbi:ABC transporter substrate-binding protein [Microbacterium capsulatum]|uniref:ABC transporter substrate-binding protein n=1 Tax=Microbacterium capsulatum TaxID=3041921 RepID=A0ABU0XIU5_9MICO|nr:ABC transporter substrate-binding protein [Microbacterium sp. ASV81]MDQ4215041.1 ABC transporter substrate-binding protein [Microbacterium sp. ASV81]